MAHYVPVFLKAFGVDIWWSDPVTLTWALKLFYIDSCLYLLILGLARASVLCFYIRLFPHERFCRLCYALLTIIAISTILFTVLSMVQCVPISYNWEGWKGDFGLAKCLNLNLLSWSTSAIGIAFDTTILVIPLPLVVKIRSTPRRKFYIISMFSLGIMNIISSSIRLRYNIMYGDSVNITWDYVDLIIWTGIEVATSIAVTSLPSIRLMLHRISPGVFGKFFAFGGHVEQDREQYLRTREVQNLDVEELKAKGITANSDRSRREHEDANYTSSDRSESHTSQHH
ncbi:CFEM domain-containing protein [Colletotrichum graminicola M1.001]|uniref:CFEM domain-containing protein n=1 Tax=Colletotrichum graminicola (strain M1.001 / M2 / FGSC 10212) TaxID=645133 RepID=E3QZI6_COLGM|nr:CFEM domain-containing protein [Colletotrichum graminicola M1.001]EFQ36274.1 CFEM domain-containing protein [Colletotrichum graminicola M1.001]